MHPEFFTNVASRLTFTKQYGFPVVIALDISPEHEGLEDNRFEYSITAFEIR